MNGTSDAETLLRETLTEVGAAVEPCLEQLWVYLGFLQREGEKRNISKYRTQDEILTYHFVDSLQVLRFEGIVGMERVIDIGTGPGLPGIPCALAQPAWEVALVDAQKKNGEFLRTVCEQLLPLRGRVLSERSEELAHDSTERGMYDLVLGRGVAAFPQLLELCLPFLRDGGHLLAHRGKEWRDELGEATNAFEALGGEFVEAMPYTLPGRDAEQAVLVVGRVGEMSDKYPRKPGRIRKNPL